MTALLPGLLTGLGLIIAIGAQNAFVLRQGLQRHHIGLVVAICALSDAVLITAGVAGVGAVVREHETALTALKWVGAAYLVGFGLMSLWRARTAQSLRPADRDGRSWRVVAATTLALTWLNPHVYLDTVLMLGSIANQHGDPGRWWFAVGAVLGSVLWFTGLGYGARSVSHLAAQPSTWRALDVVIGVVMIALALRLLTS
ncbi:LysE/ArgO family amino acid transporter [Luteipulveratus halotolerans]|uniref:Amino acid transporter n=1 Tax=Luteipulveratus halotolerans TaxID=1631356 RepID=A0A0L6CLI0_9MICO|nr:LysE/ArgO family amino acid transporter [Luteipulveratus halotolerans]KNX38579.1 amino acid transporter [Luteipulveratus halotolerans]